MSMPLIFQANVDDDMDDVIYLDESDVVDDSCPEEDDYYWCPRIVSRQDNDDVSSDSDDVRILAGDVTSDVCGPSSSSSSSENELYSPNTSKKTLTAERVLGQDKGELCNTPNNEESSVAGMENMQDENPNTDISSTISSEQGSPSPIRPYSPSYSCPGCDKSFISKFWLSRHHESCMCSNKYTSLDSSAEKKPFRVLLTPDTTILQCVVCPQMFLTQRALDFHSMKHEKYERGSRAAKRFRCPECEFPMYYTSAEGLRSHREQKHQPMFVPQRPTAIVTMAMQAGGSDVRGDDSKGSNVMMEDSIGSDVTARDSGENDIESSENKTSVNPRSSMKFGSKSIVKSAALGKPGDSIGTTYACSMGKKLFTNHAAQIPHVASIHQIEKNAGNAEKKLNRRKKTSKPGNNIKCNICGESFCQVFNLRQHKRIHEEIDRKTGTVKKYRCNVCKDTFFKSTGGLWNHNNQYHSGVIGDIGDKNRMDPMGDAETNASKKEKQTITCDVCNFTFKLEFYHRAHKQVHNRFHPSTGEEKRYKCQICCDTYYTNPGTLYRHMTIYHGSSTKYGKGNHSKVVLRKGTSKYRPTKADVSKSKSKSRKYRDVENTHISQSKIKKGRATVRPSCSVCLAVFADKAAQSQHLAIHQYIDPGTGKPKAFTCHYCKKSYFDNKVGLRSHQVNCQRRQSAMKAAT